MIGGFEARAAVRAARQARKSGAALRLFTLVSVLALVALELGYRLGEERIWRASEQRCNAVANEMYRSGDWLVPRTSSTESPRLQKPPLFYWAATAAAVLAGGPSVVTLRGVSLLAGLGLAVVTFFWGRSLGGWSCGIACTLSLAATAMFVTRARYGDAETLLALTTTLSLGLFERLCRKRERWLLPVFSISLALALLAKATAAAFTIGVPIGVWLTLHPSLLRALRPRVIAWGAASLTVVLAWYAAILIDVPGAANDVLGFTFHPLGVAHAHDSASHFRPLYYYLLRFPLQALPASLLLPWLIRDAVRTHGWRDDPRVRFIATCLVSIFVAWSLVPQKQMHYLLPIVPLYALLCGVFVARRLRVDLGGEFPL